MNWRSVTTIGVGLLMAVIYASGAAGADWPQWCGTDGKNMVSAEKGLPDSFVPGEKSSQGRQIDRATAKNVKWGVKVCQAFYSTPSVAAGNVYIGGVEPDNGLFTCLDAVTGQVLWQWKAPAKKIPHVINDFLIGIGGEPAKLGVCSSAAVDHDRVTS